MPQWVVVLFWIWVVVSLVIFVARRVRSRRTKLAGGSDVEPAPASPGALLDKEWPEPPPPEPGDDSFRLDPHAPPEPPDPSSTDTPLGDHDEPRPPSTGHVPPPADTPGIPTGAPTLPELLAGITLPHELVPLTQLDTRIDVATHVIVATEKASAEVVRDGMIDELERLGYDIEHESMMHLVATGPRGRVLIDIHPDGPGVTEAGVARFPTAPEGSVVVELRVG